MGKSHAKDLFTNLLLGEALTDSEFAEVYDHGFRADNPDNPPWSQLTDSQKGEVKQAMVDEAKMFVPVAGG